MNVGWPRAAGRPASCGYSDWPSGFVWVLWLGEKPASPAPFADAHGKTCALNSAVDLLDGINKITDMHIYKEDVRTTARMERWCGIFHSKLTRAFNFLEFVLEWACYLELTDRGSNMDNSITAVGGRTQDVVSTGAVVVHQLPLSFLKSGQTATIAKVRGKDSMHHHLENLGFVEGARIIVRSEASGDLIVEVKGTQVALNKHIASHIITNATA